MSKQKNKPFILIAESSVRQLLASFVYILILLLLTTVFTALNTRHEQDFRYDSKNHCIILPEYDPADPDNYYIDNRWVLIPNVTDKDIEDGRVTFDDIPNIPHADNVRISSLNGWNDPGPDAVWNNTRSNGPEIIAFGRGNRTLAMTYAISIDIGSGSAFHLGIPNINGSATVFCNGIKMGVLGDMSNKNSGFDVTSGYQSIPIYPDENGKAYIMIAVESDAGIYNPGLLSTPSLNNKTSDTKMIFVPAIWITSHFTLLVLIVIGGLMISRTFSRRGKLFLLILMLAGMIVYHLYDVRYLVVDSLARLVICYFIRVFLCVVLTHFIASLLPPETDRRHKRISTIHCLGVTVIGIVLIMILFFNRSLIGTTYPSLTTLIFSSVVCMSCVIKLMFLYYGDKNLSLGLFSTITMYFVFLSMQSENDFIYNIPLYSVYTAFALLLLLIYFLRRYVHQYRELKDTTDHLQFLVNEKTIHISEINRDLLNTNKKLMKNEEARKNVLSNVSHDLRTPITAIRGYAELLSSAGDNMSREQRNSYLTNIIRRSVQMERIVSDIVELTRMESSTNEFNFADISLAMLLDETFMLYETDLRETTKKIFLEIPEDDLLMVRADQKKLSRVFDNLISNSINYSGDDAVIKIRAWRSDPDKDISEQRIHITVTDNGIGIPPESINLIFDRFYRAANSGKNIKGTGLGLSIVKMIVDRHDAEISVESTLGAGTEFHIVMKPAY